LYNISIYTDTYSAKKSIEFEKNCYDLLNWLASDIKRLEYFRETLNENTYNEGYSVLFNSHKLEMSKIFDLIVEELIILVKNVGRSVEG